MLISFSWVRKNWKDDSFSTEQVSKERRKTQSSAPAEGQISRTYQLSMFGRGQLAGQHRRSTAQAVFCSPRTLSLFWERRPKTIVVLLSGAHRLWLQIRLYQYLFHSELFWFFWSPALFLVDKSRYISGRQHFPFPLCCGVTAAFPWFFSAWIHFIVSHQISLLLKSWCHSPRNWEIVSGSA